MRTKIEKRPYGSESTSEECQLLDDRVFKYNDNVIIFQEVPVPSKFQLDIFFAKIEKLTRTLTEFNLIIDLTEAQRPGAEIMDYLRVNFSKLSGLNHVAIFTGKNFILNVAAKFVMNSLQLKSFSIHKSLDQALEEIKIAQYQQ